VEQRLQGKVEGEQEEARFLTRFLRSCWWERIGVLELVFRLMVLETRISVFFKNGALGRIISHHGM